MAQPVTPPLRQSDRILVFPDPEQMSQEAANQFTRLARRQVRTSGRFSVALAGGSTPRRLYERLAGEPYRSRIPWRSVHAFWGDERCVPPGHPDSNFRMAREALFSSVSITRANIHRIPVDRADPERAASLYEQTLREFFHLSAEGWPEFDLMFLGLGEDGHTASLFPSSPALRESRRLAVATAGGHPNLPRVTLTLPVLNHAKHLLWLVAGSEKAPAVQSILGGRKGPGERPALSVQPVHGPALWLLDEAAAAGLRAKKAKEPCGL